MGSGRANQYIRTALCTRESCCCQELVPVLANPLVVVIITSQHTLTHGYIRKNQRTLVSHTWHSRHWIMNWRTTRHCTSDCGCTRYHTQRTEKKRIREPGRKNRNWTRGACLWKFYRTEARRTPELRRHKHLDRGAVSGALVEETAGTAAGGAHSNKNQAPPRTKKRPGATVHALRLI